MNEKLRKMYAQASEYAMNQLGHANGHAGETLAEVANTKFAELIIKECMFVGRTSQINNGLVDADIKDHFGVE